MRRPLRSWASAALLSALAGPCFPAGPGPDPGERLYREGILPSGRPAPIVLAGTGVAPGTTFSCASCHTRSGVPPMDEGNPVRPLPVNGARLYQPRWWNLPGLTGDERRQLLPPRMQTPPVRPAYTDETLARAIRDGVDPTGRALGPGMPRYPLSDPDMAVLVGYLKRLSAEPSPGVTGTALALATVIAGEVPAADRDAMLRPLEETVRVHNNLVPNATRGRMGSTPAMQEMAIGYRKWTLAVWTLAGAPETWPGQLEEHCRREPVFALVGGLAAGGWEPVHRFCEERQLPCLFPLTDLPAVAPTDFYTLYFSRGLYQEGEAAARFLAARPRPVVQLVGPGPEAKALAQGFQTAWAAKGRPPVRTLALDPAAGFPRDAMGKAGADLVVWAGPEAYPLLAGLARDRRQPEAVLLSSTLLRERIWALPGPARTFTFLTYPYRRPGPRTVPGRMGARPVVVDKPFQANDGRIASRTATLAGLVGQGLARIERNYYRDHLLDQMGSLGEVDITDYETLAFAPGQRYVSEGCYIMQLGDGPDPALVPRSAWIVP